MKKQRGGDPDIYALAQEAVQIISEGFTHSLVNVKSQITAGFNLIYKKGKKEGEEASQEASLQEIAKLNSDVSGLNGEKKQLAADKTQLAAANKNLTAENKRLNTEYTDLITPFYISNADFHGKKNTKRYKINSRNFTYDGLTFSTSFLSEVVKDEI